MCMCMCMCTCVSLRMCLYVYVYSVIILKLSVDIIFEEILELKLDLLFFPMPFYPPPIPGTHPSLDYLKSERAVKLMGNWSAKKRFRTFVTCH